MGRGRPLGSMQTTAGWESLRNAIYCQAVQDLRYKRQLDYRDNIKQFLVSGAYMIDPEVGRKILERVEGNA